jgi:hypothetical protein
MGGYFPSLYQQQQYKLPTTTTPFQTPQFYRQNYSNFNIVNQNPQQINISVIPSQMEQNQFSPNQPSQQVSSPSQSSPSQKVDMSNNISNLPIIQQAQSLPFELAVILSSCEGNMLFLFHDIILNDDWHN